MRRALVPLLISAALLAPCWWRPRIHAGDLSSHTYNAWLAIGIEAGTVPGLAIRPQRTNVLFDLALEWLVRRAGVTPGERVAVSACVLIFFWGALRWVRAASRRAPPHVWISLAVISYGWLFHMGFFNLYLAFGLGFWAMALAWKPVPARLAAAVPLLALALAAHPMGFLWGASAIAYRMAAPRISPRGRWLPVCCSVAAIGFAVLAASSRYQHLWRPGQLLLWTGADQAWIFGQGSFLLAIALLAVWTTLFARVRLRRVAKGVPFQLWLIAASAVIIVPEQFVVPPYQHVLGYLGERTSVLAAVFACAVMARTRASRGQTAALATVAAAFFAILFVRTGEFDRFEDGLSAALRAVPPGSRVVLGPRNPGNRVDFVIHSIDRACIGRCYSYANYEPATRQFRIQPSASNRVVLEEYADFERVQFGEYRVRERDVPLWRIERAPGGFAARRVSVGELLSGTPATGGASR